MFRLSDSEAKKAGLKVAKSNKYGVRQDSLGKLGRTIDGIQFDSQKEANRYCELKRSDKLGTIGGFQVQPTFPLIVNGKNCGEYRGDFRYFDLVTGREIIEDVKGMKTQLYRLKKKLVAAIYGIEIREV